MLQFDKVERSIANAVIRISNLEEVKSGIVESAILVRNKVFCGRPGIIAWIDESFPRITDTPVEAACFATPHLALNMVSAGI